MAIAQMNWGRLLYPLNDPGMKEFADHLDRIYRIAEEAPGFIWRIDEDQLATELARSGFCELTSATVSVWHSLEDLRKYTYDTEHGLFLKRTREWFEAVDGPQLVIWSVKPDAEPDFFEAKKRLDHLRHHGPSEYAYGWDKNLR